MFLVYKSKTQKLINKEYIASMIIGLILLIPFIISVLTGGGYASASGTLIFSSAPIQAQLLEFRSYMIQLPPVLSKILFNMPALTLWQWINNVATYFNIPFFFISGSTHGNHGIGNVGQFYLFEFPFILIGIWILIRQKTKFSILLLLWAVVTIAICSLTRDVPHATRSFFLLPTLIVASAIGCFSIINFIKNYIRLKYSMVLIVPGVMVVIFNIFYYFSSYYLRFPVAYAKAWNAVDYNVSQFLKTHQKEYNSIIIDKDAGFPYTSLLFYTEYPPQDFQRAEWSKDDSEGFSYPIQFGKYEFKTIDWNIDLQRPNTLILTKPDNLPKGTPTLETFYYPERPVVIAVKQEIFQYPIVESAYSVVITKQ